MEPQPHHETFSAPLSQVQRADRICDQFEAAWKAAGRPRIDDFLARVPPAERPDLLRELLVLDLDYRRQLGESPTLERYGAEYPALELDRFVNLFADRSQPLPSNLAEATVQFTPSDARTPDGRLPRIRYLGDYELLAEIAHGGMGVIYKARQVSLNRTVAVKMILAGQLATKADRDRFHSEAQAAALLDHPNIVPIFEVGEHEGQHYFSMGYVDGPSLASRLADGPLPPKEAAELVATVAEAVEYAHRQGVIHRDIKPSNILIDGKGHPRVTDFGLAKRVDSGSELTATGQVLGTPSYMPPEQAAGQINAVGPAADVYALGALLYSTLTGRPPFQAATPLETLQQVLEREPVAVRQLNTAVPRDLETIVLKCLEKPIPRRYVTAQALVDDLRRYLEGRPILARPVGRLQRGWRWCKRQPVVAALSGAFVLALVLGTTVSLSYAFQAKAEKTRTIAEKERADRKATEAMASAKRARLSAANLQIARAAELWRDDPTNARRLLTDVRHCPPEMRDFSWGLVYAMANRRRGECRVSKVNKHGGEGYSIKCAPDGKTMAVSTGESVLLLDAASGKQNEALPARGVDKLAYSPKGDLLATNSYYDGRIRVWRSGTREPLATLQAGKVRSLCFDMRGDRLVSAAVDAPITIWDVTAAKAVVQIANTEGYDSVAFLPDGDGLIAMRDKTLRSWKLDGKQAAAVVEAWTFEPPNAIGGGFEISRDRRVLALRTSAEVAIYKSRDHVQTGTVSLPGDWPGAAFIRFSPSSDALAVGTVLPSGDVLIQNLQSGERFVLDDPIDRSIYRTDMDWSPDGATLVVAQNDGIVRFFDAHPRINTWSLEHQSDWRKPIAVSGNVTATADYGDIAIMNFNPTSAFFTTAFNGPEGIGPINTIDISPDGIILMAGAAGSIRFGATDDGTNYHEAGTYRRQGPIWTAKFSPTGNKIASAGADGTIHLWTSKSSLKPGLFGSHRELSLEPLFTLAGNIGGVRTVAFTPTGDLLASAGDDRAIRLWDLNAKRQVAELHVDEAQIFTIVFSPDGHRLAAAGTSAAIRLWDVAARNQCNVLQDHKGAVYTLAFDPHGQEIFSGGKDGTVRRWSISDGRVLERVSALEQISPPAAITGLALNSAGTLFYATADGSCYVRYANGKAPEYLGKAIGKAQKYLAGQIPLLRCLAVSPDGRAVAAGSEDTTIEVWDIASGKSRLILRGHQFPIRDLAFSPDGMKLLSRDTQGETIVWDVKTGQRFATLPEACYGGAAMNFAAPDRVQIYDYNAFGRKARFRTWHLPPGSQSVTAIHDAGNIIEAKYSRDGTRIVATRDSPDRTFVGIDSATGSPIETGIHTEFWWNDRWANELMGIRRTDSDNAWAISASGNILANVLGDRKNAIALWDLQANIGRAVLVSGPAEVERIEFTPDEKTLAAGYMTGEVKFWDVVIGLERMSLRSAASPVLSLAFSADGNVLAVPHRNGEIRIFQARQDRLLADLPCGEKPVRMAKFYRDCSQLLTAGDDGYLRLWEVPGGRLLAQAPAKVERLALSADGKSVVVFSEGGAQVLDSQSLACRHAFTTAWKSGDIAADGSCFAMVNPVSADRVSIEVYDPHTERLISRQEMNCKSSRDPLCRFSPDGGKLAIMLVDSDDTNEKASVAVTTIRGKSSSVVTHSIDEKLWRLYVFDVHEEQWHVSPPIAAVGMLDWLDSAQLLLDGISKSPRILQASDLTVSGTLKVDFDGNGLGVDSDRFLTRLGTGHGNTEHVVRAYSPGRSQVALWLSSVRGEQRVQNYKVLPEPARILLYDVARHECTGSVGGIAAAWCVACFSPDGRTLAAGSTDGVIETWDLETERPLEVLTGHSGAITSLAFSPDGKTLSSTGEEGMAALWRPVLANSTPPEAK